MTECQRETGVLNGLTASGRGLLAQSEREYFREQGKASEPSVTKYWGTQRLVVDGLISWSLAETAIDTWREECLTESIREWEISQKREMQKRKTKNVESLWEGNIFCTCLYGSNFQECHNPSQWFNVMCCFAVKTKKNSWRDVTDEMWAAQKAFLPLLFNVYLPYRLLPWWDVSYINMQRLHS